MLGTYYDKKWYFLQFAERPCHELSFGTVNEILSVSSNKLSADDVYVEKHEILLKEQCENW